VQYNAVVSQDDPPTPKWTRAWGRWGRGGCADMTMGAWGGGKRVEVGRDAWGSAWEEGAEAAWTWGGTGSQKGRDRTGVASLP
jgi:hypothetical protein